MKLPRYIKVEIVPEKNNHPVKCLFAKISIKKWGVPFLIFKSAKETFNWWQWILYPYFCFKVIKNWGVADKCTQDS
jgi:hypothetical protein